jgi:hypothetical protein
MQTEAIVTIREDAEESTAEGIERRYFAGVVSLVERARLDWSVEVEREAVAQSSYGDTDRRVRVWLDSTRDGAVQRRADASLAVVLHRTVGGRAYWATDDRAEDSIYGPSVLTVWSRQPGQEHESTAFALRGAEARRLLDRWLPEYAARCAEED